MENKNTNMTIFAEALAYNRTVVGERIKSDNVGYARAQAWKQAVLAMRMPAYDCRAYRRNNMGASSEVSPADVSKLMSAIKTVCEMIGEVNGAKLYPSNLVEEVIACAVRIRKIDITPEMAHARADMKTAREIKTEDPTAENISAYEECVEIVKTLEKTPGNCKDEAVAQTASAFVKQMEIALGDAINKQQMKTAEQVEAEEAAIREARKAAKKKSKKKSAKTHKSADKVESDSVQALPHELAV